MTKRVTPREAYEQMTNEGFAYLDVRTPEEFEAGHPAGAFNVPLLLDGPAGRAPNPAFMRAVRATFATDRKLVVGCLGSARATSALEALEREGYAYAVLQLAGWGGAVDAFGRTKEAGWKAAGLPIATNAEPGRSWAELAKKT